MSQPSVTHPTCIGIDLGDSHSHLFVLDLASGEVLEEGRIPCTPAAFRRRFAGQPPARIAIEVGCHSPWVSRLLAEAGHEVVVANARKLRLIYENDSKSDRVDAQYLARLAAADPQLLHPVRHRGAKAQADRAVLVARDQAVQCRTRLVNCVRGLVKSLGHRLPKCDPEGFHNRVRETIPAELLPAVEPLLDVLAILQQKIRALDKVIERLCQEQYSETARLRQIKGVGPVSALNFVLTLEDPTRFTKSRTVGSYLGLRPGRKSSGRGDPELHITKAGDTMLRRHLVNCAQYILGPFGEDSDLRRWGLKLAGHGAKSAKKRAIIAVARKLAVLLHRLWLSGATYEPLRNSREPAHATAQ
jgi:transposase